MKRTGDQLAEIKIGMSPEEKKWGVLYNSFIVWQILQSESHPKSIASRLLEDLSPYLQPL